MITLEYTKNRDEKKRDRKRHIYMFGCVCVCAILHSSIVWIVYSILWYAYNTHHIYTIHSLYVHTLTCTCMNVYRCWWCCCCCYCDQFSLCDTQQAITTYERTFISKCMLTRERCYHLLILVARDSWNILIKYLETKPRNKREREMVFFYFIFLLCSMRLKRKHNSSSAFYLFSVFSYISAHTHTLT